MSYNLIFEPAQYTIQNITMKETKLTFRAYENIVYVAKPAAINYQKLSIYVPENYYEGKSIGTYDLHSAPILMSNTVGGYKPGWIEQPDTAFLALLHGYVVVSAAVRGRGLKNKNGEYIGYAPACVVDQKAAVRYLRFNRVNLPGDTNKIITNGTSAGGALSALLGVTGNHPDYEPYLQEIGAAPEEDHVFASSCYCPITNLDHADMAYEWEFSGIDDKAMTQEQITLSRKLKKQFPKYLNSLNLADADSKQLTIAENGEGSFREFIKSYVMGSAQQEIDKGGDLSSFDWVHIKDKKVYDIDWEKYIYYRKRKKTTPAFDKLELSTPENELFGNKSLKGRHFTKLSQMQSAVNGEMAEPNQITMMNPMSYIADARADNAKNFRIRHGCIDSDTSLAISAILTAALRQNGVAVDYQLSWETSHSGNYDLEDLFSWIDGLS